MNLEFGRKTLHILREFNEEIEHKEYLEDPQPPLIESSGFFIDEFRVSSVFYLNKLPAIHKDPFDRLLIAHCLDTNAMLMSTDSIFCKYPIRCIE